MFRHLNLDHPSSNDGEIYCGYDKCQKIFSGIRKFKDHFYRVHSGSSLSFASIEKNISPNSYFAKFFEQHARPNTYFVAPDITMEPFDHPSMHSLNSAITDINDYSAVQELAKIAFKYFYAVPFCKSNLLRFFSEILKFISLNGVSNEVMLYASEVLLNENRIKNYFI